VKWVATVVRGTSFGTSGRLHLLLASIVERTSTGGHGARQS
jgi:hypothetical protein